MMLITHDLGRGGGGLDHVVVMYAGRVAERGTVEEVLERPSHPYTWGLLGSMPSVDGQGRPRADDRARRRRC